MTDETPKFRPMRLSVSSSPRPVEMRVIAEWEVDTDKPYEVTLVPMLGPPVPVLPDAATPPKVRPP